MKNLTKGGYQLISLLGIVLEATVSPIPFSKDEIKKLQNSNGKRIVLTDLYLDGEKVNDITANLVYDEDNGVYLIKGVYGFDLSIDVENAQISIIEVDIKKLAKEEVESAESGTPITLLGLDSNGDLVKGVNLNGNFTAESIIENMNGYSFSKATGGLTNKITLDYVGIVKNGNKLTFAFAGSIATGETGIDAYSSIGIGTLSIPNAIGTKLFPLTGTYLDMKVQAIFHSSPNLTQNVIFYFVKDSNSQLRCLVQNNTALTAERDYIFRYEVTFLLSENLAE